jgi:trans-aconitate 3-methyltransferase
MADPAPTPTAPEKTFRSYTHEQGKTYAQGRRGYHPNLYQTIIDHHTSTGGQLITILDVGCGPGTAIRELAPRFTYAIGLDPSEGMISTARSLGGASSTSQPIRFEVSTAEDLGFQLSPPIPDSSVDLITAATAAHWFDMSGFWPRAAQVLKPGGTVALWTISEWHPDPSMPNGPALLAAMSEFHDRHLKPYTKPGNQLAKDLYIDLPLPWNLTQPVLDFDENTFYRKEWYKDGVCAEGDEFLMQQLTLDLGGVEKTMETASQVTRWREAHPDAVGTERDVVKMMVKEVERLLHEAGVERGKEMIKGGLSGVLLMVKKKA